MLALLESGLLGSYLNNLIQIVEQGTMSLRTIGQLSASLVGVKCVVEKLIQ